MKMSVNILTGIEIILLVLSVITVIYILLHISEICLIYDRIIADLLH